MTVEKIFIADDGKKFTNENDCRKHEKEVKEKEKNDILEEIKELDLKIWKKYHPDYKDDGNEPELYQAPMWLNTDICEIIMDFPESENDIISMIKSSKHGEKIIKDYLKMDFIKNKIRIRKDFLSALKSVKDGADLSADLEWSFSKKDLAELAKLHKANKCRRKIEELLTNCNFHYECGKFNNKEYDEFI